MEKIQMTEEQAREFLHASGLRIIEERIQSLKSAGYIKKSPLRQKVEEAEEMWDGYQNRRTQFVPENYNQMIEHQHETIQLLKVDHPEFKEAK